MKITKALSAAILAVLAAPAALAIAAAPAAQANTSGYLQCLSSYGVTGGSDRAVELGHDVYLDLVATHKPSVPQAKLQATPGVSSWEATGILACVLKGFPSDPAS